MWENGRMKNNRKPQTLSEAMEELNAAFSEFGDAVVTEFRLRELADKIPDHWKTYMACVLAVYVGASFLMTLVTLF